MRSKVELETVIVKWRNRFGQGTNNEPLCALARPYRQLFEEGKPVGKINRLFLKLEKQPMRTVGSLCYSPGERVLFFPGLVSRHVNWVHTRNNQLSTIKTRGLIDHLTLEKWREYYLTILDSKGRKRDRLEAHHLKTINDKTAFWFGLTLRDPDVFETTPQELTMSFVCPASDLERRYKLFLQSNKGASPHLLQFDTVGDRNMLNPGEFLHLDFFFAPAEIDVKTFPCFAPMSEPRVSGCCQKSKSTGIQFRAHPVTLEGVASKVWVVVTKHVGIPNEKAVLICG